MQQTCCAQQAVLELAIGCALLDMALVQQSFLGQPWQVGAASFWTVSMNPAVWHVSRKLASQDIWQVCCTHLERRDTPCARLCVRQLPQMRRHGTSFSVRMRVSFQSQIGPQEVTSGHIRPQQVTAGYIRSQQATSGHNRSHQVTSGHIRSHQATKGHIRSHQVTTGHVRSRQATTDHIRPHQVTSRHIQ